MANRRCRAQVWEPSGWRSYQCTRRAKAIREVHGTDLPVCGTHLRPRFVDAYQPRDAYDAAVEAVMR